MKGCGGVERCFIAIAADPRFTLSTHDRGHMMVFQNWNFNSVSMSCLENRSSARTQLGRTGGSEKL